MTLDSRDRLGILAKLAVGAALWSAAVVGGCGGDDIAQVTAPGVDASSSTPDATIVPGSDGGACPLTTCNGNCVDTANDPANCGACGTACVGGQVCSKGVCGLACGGGTTMCGTTCNDTQSDPNNCGGCGTKCAAGQVCSMGACALSCGGGTTACGAACVDTNLDGANCGGCAKVCGTGSVCSAGTCQTSCGQGLAVCRTTADGGSSDGGNGAAFCVDPNNDAHNCGGCGIACSGGQLCTGGHCQLSCTAGFLNCGGKCVDPKTDRQYCGATLGCATGDAGGTTGIACSAGSICTNGTCTPSCPGSEISCGGNCVDPQTNRQYCGATAGCGAGIDAGVAGAACLDGQVCSGGVCTATCGAPATRCVPDGGSPYCSDLSVDRNNCGTCGNVCPGGAAAACAASTCHVTVSLTGAGTLGNPYVGAGVYASCNVYKTIYGAAAATGYYSVNPGSGAVTVYCDQSLASGGWTRCLTFTNTAADDFGTNLNWFDTCVANSNASWAGTGVMVTLRDQGGTLLYNSDGTRVGVWTNDQITSTDVAANQYTSVNHNRLITLSNTDRLMIAGRFSVNGGCGGSMGNGYGIVVYPNPPNYYSNPKMFVFPYQELTGGYNSARSFGGWTTSAEISWSAASFNSCYPFIGSAPGLTAQLGTFDFYIR